MGGLAQSVGHGLSSAIGGAFNTIASTLGSIVNQTSHVVPGGLPIVILIVAVVAVLLGVTLIRR